MAAKTEGIASLSMYNDEEEEEEEDEGERRGAEDREKGDGAATTSDSDSAHEKTPPAPYSRTTPPPEEDFHHKTLPSPAPPTPSPMPTRTPTPTPPRPPQHEGLPPPPASMPSPLPPSSLSNASDAHRSGKWSLTIVDYAHDEVAMSPEAEEGEIMSTGRVVFGAELLTSVEIIEEKTLLGIVQTSTPSTQGTPPQSSEQHEQSKSGTNMTMDMMEIEEESLHVEMDVAVSLETEQEVDPLKSFLPPPLTVKCSEELQEKINKFLAYKKAGKSFNAVLRNRKDYRNPDFLQHAVTYQDIDQIGTCLSKDVFDPHGYDKSDYYDEIEADIKRGIEKREQEKKKSLEFVPGGNQAASKISTQIPAAAAAGGLQSVSAVADGLAKESRQNKKSKWDKVDSDSVSNASVHAALLSAANAGAGYTAFAQQKRREAEEKRSSERKFDKRS